MDVTKLMPEYFKYLQAIGIAPLTLKSIKSLLACFVRFLHQEGTTELEQITTELLEEYQQEVAFTITATGKPMAAASQGRRIIAVRKFTRYLKEHDYLVHDPGAVIRLPKVPRRTLRSIMGEAEIKKLLAAPDTRTNRGYRNRIILELLYDTGIRRAEIAGIRLADIDLDGGFILIHGKGGKDRVVPVSARVCGLLRNYILAVRPTFLAGEDPGWLILNRCGERMQARGIWYVVRRCLTLSKLKNRVTTHTFRHTCATHMLRNGAPVRHIQEMLGHESLESTQIYTHVTINDLKEAHAKYHPSERMQDKH